MIRRARGKRRSQKSLRVQVRRPWPPRYPVSNRATIRRAPMRTESHKRTEDIVVRLNRRLRTFCQCYSTFFQDQTEQELLQSTCEILAAGGELRLAWVGYCD